MPTTSQFPLLIALGIALVVLHGCDDAPQPTSSGGAFDVVVETRGRPRYSWYAEGAYSLRITPADAPATLVWGVTDTTGRLASPIIHGTVPSGAVSVVRSSVPLEPDTQYRVTVTLVDGRTGLQHFRTAPTHR